MKTKDLFILPILTLALIACSEDDEPQGPTPLDPDMAAEVSVDRFSADAATLFVRTADNGLPEANEPINFDDNPLFITKGLGPDGEMVEYYNFDVMSTTPAPIFALFREGEDMPVDGQLNIINVIPGDAGYNDFWLVNKVTVPADYVANTATSYQDILDGGYTIEPLTLIVNCPVVPDGSIASKRFLASEDPGLTRGWYDDMVVYYFNFSEKELIAENDAIPVSDIYVSFNINPDMDGGGPPSGFKTEDDMATGQTHNVPETLPEDTEYSPLWVVNIYDNADFDMVSDLPSATSANIMAEGAAIVNCPIVSVQ